MYNMPPPIITEMYIASAMEPESRYFMYSTKGYSSTIWRAILLTMRLGMTG